MLDLECDGYPEACDSLATIGNLYVLSPASEDSCFSVWCDDCARDCRTIEEPGIVDVYLPLWNGEISQAQERALTQWLQELSLWR